jgi:UDP-glucose 4-epimerase
MKILITGGAGFIGSNLSDRLIKEGYDVIVADNLVSGKVKNINPEARFYQIDIRDKNLSDVFKKERPNFVSHHAAQIDVRRSVNDPIFDAEVNVLKTLNILENCRKYGVKRVVFASSGRVLYGEVEKGKKASEDFPLQPISPYGITKLCVEANLSALSKGENIELNIGTGVTTSVQELFFLLQKITVFTKEPIYGTQRPGELQMSCLDCSKAKKLLDFSPKKDLNRGLLETVEYFRKR